MLYSTGVSPFMTNRISQLWRVGELPRPDGPLELHRMLRIKHREGMVSRRGTQPRPPGRPRPPIEVPGRAARPRYATSYFSFRSIKPNSTCRPDRGDVGRTGNIHRLLSVWLIFTYNTHTDTQRYGFDRH